MYRTIQNKQSALKFREILDLAPQPLRLAYDPPEESNLGLKLRATFSRSITAGVAATFNGAVRRMQFAAANDVAYSMIPPIPILPTARTRTRGQRLGTAHALSRVSASPAVAHFFSNTLTRESATRSESVIMMVVMVVMGKVVCARF